MMKFLREKFLRYEKALNWAWKIGALIIAIIIYIFNIETRQHADATYMKKEVHEEKEKADLREKEDLKNWLIRIEGKLDNAILNDVSKPHHRKRQDNQ
jgi:hypothetical protein